MVQLLLKEEHTWGVTLETLFCILSSDYDTLFTFDIPETLIVSVLRGAIFFSRYVNYFLGVINSYFYFLFSVTYYLVTYYCYYYYFVNTYFLPLRCNNGNSMAMWGSLRIPRFRSYWSTTLGSLLVCLKQIFSITKSPDLALETVLSVQRLVRKHGKSLATE